MSPAKKRAAQGEQAARRITTRIYPEDAHALAALCELLDCTEAEVIRRALAALAKRERIG